MPTEFPTPERSFNCPHCQAPFRAYDLSESSYFCCAECRTYFHYGDTGPMEILTAFPPTPTEPLIPLGAEGYLDGTWIRVTGYLRKREVKYDESWMEYVLMTNGTGYQMLSEYNGHWSLIRPAEGHYQEEKGQIVRSENREYKLYNQYNCLILSASGEFFWNILDDNRLTISEYIHPPYLLSHEQGVKNPEWYQATYKTPAEIAQAFGLTEARNALPRASGVGAIQPNSARQKQKVIGWLASRLAMVVVGLQVVFFLLKPPKTRLDQPYFWDSDSTKQSRSQPLVSPSFAIDGPAAVGIRLKVDVDNNWFELPVSLINEQSGQTYEFTRIVEYYHGVEGGESWTEGAQEDEAVLSRIPAGQYHLNFYPSSEGKNRVNFQVKVVQNPVLYSNFFLILALIAVYPVMLFFKGNTFEQKRWEQSDFGP
ncbi:hypothetical protein GCM10027299_23240 [Larkinella ripae]